MLDHLIPPPAHRLGIRWAKAEDRLLTPGSHHRYAVVRTGLAAVIGLRIAFTPQVSSLDQPPELFTPPAFLSWLDGMPPGNVVVGLQALGILAALASIFGFRPSASFATLWIVHLVLAGLHTSFGKVLHNDVLVLLAAAPLVLGPCRARLGDLRRSQAAGWPTRAALLVVAFGYAAAGLQKLRWSGLDWALGDNMRWTLLHASVGNLPPFPWLTEAVADLGRFTTSLAAGSLFFELTFPLVLLVRRLRPFYAGGAVLIHASTWLLLGLDYWLWAATAVLVLGRWDGHLWLRFSSIGRGARTP